MSVKIAKRICTGDYPEAKSSILSNTFGELVKLAFPKLLGYHSDLFHDATALSEMFDVQHHHQRSSVPGKEFVFEFFYTVRDSGTHLYWDTPKMDEGTTWTVTISKDGPWWVLGIAL